VRRQSPRLIRHAEILELPGGMLHDLPVACAAYDDPDQRLFHSRLPAHWRFVILAYVAPLPFTGAMRTTEQRAAARLCSPLALLLNFKCLTTRRGKRAVQPSPARCSVVRIAPVNGSGATYAKITNLQWAGSRE